MDKGMDIEALRATLAWHAGLCASPIQLAEVSRRLLRAPVAPKTLENLPDTLAALARERAREPRWDLAERALRWHEIENRHIVICGTPEYPVQLCQIPTPPLVLFIVGDIGALTRRQFAIVGSRNATRGACDFAMAIAAQLAERDVAITSGLALGVDAAAHRGALASNGVTLAVLGCGIDRTYPARHHELAHQIVERGALVSEFPLGTAPKPPHFPQRNRLIAGLTCGTLVVEAAARSGSISTAMHALEQGREIFAVPGSVHNPLSRGCHALIKQGAKLTESITDIFDELPHLATREDGASNADVLLPSSRQTLPRGCDRLLDACGWGACSIDELVERSGLTVPDVCSMLLPLELAGIVEQRANGTYIRIR